MLERIGSLKLLQPDLEIWVAVGGWSFNDAWQPTHTTFSDIASSKENQDRFIKSVKSFMSTYGFDGIDIDWYVSWWDPAQRCIL
jgi:chitinase